MSLESGTTLFRLNQELLPDPGSPIARTTTPFGGRDATTGGTAGGPVGAADSATGGAARPAADGEAGYQLIREQKPDLIIRI